MKAKALLEEHASSTHFPRMKLERNATLFCPAACAVLPRRPTMSALPAELASSRRPPKSWAWCRHSWARPNSHFLMASSASCFHFCSDWNTNHTTYLQYPLLPLLLRLKQKPHHLFTIPTASTSTVTETQTTPLIYNTHCFHFYCDWNTNHTTYLQYPLLPLLLWLKHKPHHLFTIPPASTSAPTETETTPLIYNTHCFHFYCDWNTNHTTYLQYPLLPPLLWLKHKPHHLFTIPPASTSAFSANPRQRFITA